MMSSLVLFNACMKIKTYIFFAVNCGPNAYSDGTDCQCKSGYFERNEGDARNNITGCGKKSFIKIGQMFINYKYYC